MAKKKKTKKRQPAKARAAEPDLVSRVTAEEHERIAELCGEFSEMLGQVQAVVDRLSEIGQEFRDRGWEDDCAWMDWDDPMSSSMPLTETLAGLADVKAVTEHVATSKMTDDEREAARRDVAAFAASTVGRRLTAEWENIGK